MVKVKPGIFGPISGTVGEFVYRIRNGDQVKYKRPVNQKISDSPEAVTARSRFAMNVNFSRFVNSFPALKFIWKQAKIKSSNHYQKIIKSNLEFTKKYGISTRNIITTAGLPFTVEEVSIKGGEIRFRIPFDSPKLIDLADGSLFVHLVLYFYEAKEGTTAVYDLNSLTKEIPKKSAGRSYTMQLELDEKIKSNIKEYRKVILYFAAYSYVQDLKKIFWTTTFSKEINLEYTLDIIGNR